MQVTTTITPKFQVHIPALIRKKIGLTKHGRATIKAYKNKIIIEPQGKGKSILSLGGKFQVKNPIPVERIRDQIQYAEKGRY